MKIDRITEEQIEEQIDLFINSFHSVKCGYRYLFYDNLYPYSWEVTKVSSKQVNIKKWEKGRLIFNQNKGYKFIIESIRNNLIYAVY